MGLSVTFNNSNSWTSPKTRRLEYGEGQTGREIWKWHFWLVFSEIMT